MEQAHAVKGEHGDTGDGHVGSTSKDGPVLSYVCNRVNCPAPGGAATWAITQHRDEIHEQAHCPCRRPPERLPPHRDRKSVVSGKSVSVRVDLGGRRIIKKKKNKKNETQKYNKQ